MKLCILIWEMQDGKLAVYERESPFDSFLIFFFVTITVNAIFVIFISSHLLSPNLHCHYSMLDVVYTAFLMTGKRSIITNKNDMQATAFPCISRTQ